VATQNCSAADGEGSAEDSRSSSDLPVLCVETQKYLRQGSPLGTSKHAIRGNGVWNKKLLKPGEYGE